MNAAKISLLLLGLPLCGVEPIRLRPPLWLDPDQQPIVKPKEQQVSEMFSIMNNSWLRHASPEVAALAARDRGALNVNAWDGVPDSSWFTNRIGRRSLDYEQILAGLGGAEPARGKWLVEQNSVEGYTPKLRILDAAGRRYWVKFDLPAAPERNSAAERISTLVLHAAGYHVPFNSVVRFRADDLVPSPKGKFTDHLNRSRTLTEQDLQESLATLKPDAQGNYRALASLFIAGQPLGKFKYNGLRADDPNDIIPHELRRELRGLRVMASWINHADAGDKNTHDTFVPTEGGLGWVKHYLLDFGSTLGSGDYLNGPYRIGHEHLFDGAAIGKTFWSFGAWRRPWEEKGRIDFLEVGYFSVELFDPAAWKPNYPNLAFVRMDRGDAYWAARIVHAFPDGLIDRIVGSAQYSNPEAARAVATTLKRRRDLIAAYWFGQVTPLESFSLAGNRLNYRDDGVNGPEESSRLYRHWLEDMRGNRLSNPLPCDSTGCDLDLGSVRFSPPDAFGRSTAARVLIQSGVRDGKWPMPVEVVLGKPAGAAALSVLGWRHAPL